MPCPRYIMGGQTNFNVNDAGRRDVTMCTVVMTPEDGMTREGQVVQVWCPVIGWYDMAWYGMVWYGMVWYGMYGMVWYGMVWLGMVWYGIA